MIIFEKYILQSIVFSKDNENFPPDLYYKVTDGSFAIKNNSFQLVRSSEGIESKICFDTFFGAFSISGWHKISPEIFNKLGVTIRTKGTGILTIKIFDGEKTNIYKKVNLEFLETIIELDNFIYKKGILYLEISTTSDEFEFQSGYYWTTIPPTTNVSLALITPTYKRESYVLKNMELLKGLLSLEQTQFEVFLIDNGQTLSQSKFSEKIHVISNPNFGGSGGFARGLIEVFNEKKFSHILFMDDDVQIEPESIKRLISLLGYCGSDFVVGGGMISLAKKDQLFELGAEFESFKFNPCKHNINLSDPINLVQYDTIKNKIYFGWWYFATSLKTFENLGFPLPLFFQHDDREFGIRINNKGYKLLSLLGIAIWHDDFSEKYNIIREYYWLRNSLIISLIHRTDSRNIIIAYIKKLVIPCLLSYRYDQATFLIKAVEDALKGPEFLIKLNPETFHESLALFQTEKIQKIESKDLNEFFFKDPFESNSILSSRLDKVLFYLTMNGHFIPQFIRGRSFNNGHFVRPLKFKTVEKIYPKAKVLYVDPSSAQGIYQVINYSKFFSLFSRFLYVILKIYFFHNLFLTKWNKGIGNLTTKNFWEKYLRVKQ